MAQRVVVHIGLRRAGTTFLQGRLDTRRRLLAQQGVLFPGPSLRRHANAVADFVDAPGRQAGSWDSLLEEIDDHPGTAVLSMEPLTLLGPARIAQLAESLDTPDLRIVVVAADLGRTVPAMWQEVVANGRPWAWTEYVESIRADERGGRRFWRLQHAGRVVGRWASALTPDHVYVVTLPRPGAPRELLWDRFREVAGIEQADWQDPPPPDESLGAASTQVVRELALRAGDQPAPEHRRRLKALATQLMPAHTAQEDPIGFAVPDWLRQQADDIRGEIARSGVHVVGDLAELDPLDVPGADPDAVDPSARLEAALAALEATLSQSSRVTPA